MLVVDNGSTDGTADAAARAGARVVREPRRGGRSKVSGTLAGSVCAGYGLLAAALRAARGVP
jgi:hypothetical protein